VPEPLSVGASEGPPIAGIGLRRQISLFARRVGWQTPSTFCPLRENAQGSPPDLPSQAARRAWRIALRLEPFAGADPSPV
jgi:hypothetical protein